jgi:fumarate reductase subunit C
VLVLNIISFLFLVYHAVTFFDAAPRALAVHVGKTRVPEWIVGASHYAGWVVASALVCWLVLGS